MALISNNYKIVFFALLMMFSFTDPINAKEKEETLQENSHSSDSEKEFDASTLINHHIGDSHEFHIVGDISLPLPVILYTNNGVVTFMSSEFHHDQNGEVIVEKNGVTLKRIHGNIYYADKVNGHELPSITDFSARPVDISITKNVFSMFLSFIFILILFGTVAKSYNNNLVPKGLAGFLEPLVVFVKEDIAIPNIGEKNYARFMPFLLTVFFFIWINNLIGLIPFFPFSSNLTGNISFTFVMAFITFTITTLNGNKDYWKHILMPPVPKLLYPIMVPIEIIGMFTKPFALMIRLFANIAAGHIIILSLVSLIFIFKTVAIAPVSGAFVIFMSVLEMLVAALQAYVFTLLSALFIGQAVAEHDHAHD